jgi:hypothetical protein
MVRSGMLTHRLGEKVEQVEHAERHLTACICPFDRYSWTRFPRGDGVVLKTRDCTLLVLTLLLPMATLAAGGQVSAQPSACTGTVNYPITSGPQYYPAFVPGFYSYFVSNIVMTVNVSANCASITGQLNAVGGVYDTWTHSKIGTAVTTLNSVNSTYYDGHLVFYLPPTVKEHTMLLTVSIYNYNGGYGNYSGQDGTLMGRGTIVINPSPYQPAYYDCNHPSYYNSTSRYMYYYDQCY